MQAQKCQHTLKMIRVFKNFDETFLGKNSLEDLYITRENLVFQYKSEHF